MDITQFIVFRNSSKKKSIFDKQSHYTFYCFHLLLISQYANSCLLVSHFPLLLFWLKCFIVVYQAAKRSFYDFPKDKLLCKSWVRLMMKGKGPCFNNLALAHLSVVCTLTRTAYMPHKVGERGR